MITDSRLVTEEDVSVAHRRAWFPVARAEDLAAGPKAVRLLGESLVAYRTADRKVAVTRDRCPHRGAPLSLGKVVGDNIQCPYHGWQIDGTTGRCALIPSSGPDARIPPGAQIEAFPAQERFGLIWTCLEPVGLEVPDPPQIADFESWPWSIGQPVPVTCGIRHTVENFRDVAHFSFVHQKSMGYVDPLVEPLTVESDGYEVRMDRAFKVSGGYEQIWHDEMTFRYHVMPPAFIVLTMEGAEGIRHTLHAAQPVGKRESLIYFITALTPGWKGVSLDECVEYEQIIYSEDTPLISLLDPWEAPLFGVPGEQHSPADKFTLAGRRGYTDWVRDVAAMPGGDDLRTAGDPASNGG